MSAINEPMVTRSGRTLSRTEIILLSKVLDAGGAIDSLCEALRSYYVALPSNTVDEQCSRSDALRRLDSGELRLQQGMKILTQSLLR